ncbi:MAG: GIY-YIG nuclease family protein [Candidatus Saccharibacteria bacterium]|nr:GIY-YIG nuclease family protein [Candidatus Saccharibacteria bacterium]
MNFVYILQSETNKSKYYYGKTQDLKSRLKQHNSGQSGHTKKYIPWKIVWYGCFESPEKASEFEAYLKTASGKAFLRKRLV